MMDRKQSHRVTDDLPDDQLPRLGDLFRYLLEENEELYNETKLEMEEA